MPNENDWTPDKPLTDKEDEEECQREARARARVNHLVETYKPKSGPPAPKKRKGLFSNQD